MNERDDSTEDSEWAKDDEEGKAAQEEDLLWTDTLRRLRNALFDAGCNRPLREPGRLETWEGMGRILAIIRHWMVEQAKSGLAVQKEGASENQQLSATYLLALSRLMDVAAGLDPTEKLVDPDKKSEVENVLAWADGVLKKRDDLYLVSLPERDSLIRPIYESHLRSMDIFCNEAEAGDQKSDEPIVREMLSRTIALIRLAGVRSFPEATNTLPLGQHDLDSENVEPLRRFVHLPEQGRKRRAVGIVKTALRLLGLTGDEACSAVKFLVKRIDNEGAIPSVH